MANEDPRPAIRSLTPTVCALCDVPQPRDCSAEPLEPVLEVSRSAFGEGACERCLVFAPDALGDHLRAREPELFAAVERAAPFPVALQAEVPSMTPVCFASMFTGAPPSVHGIRRYERPQLACDTVFDAFARAGRRVAIVAVRDSSIDLVFRGRAVDYYSEKYDPWVTERVIGLLAAGRHELIVAYHQEYDDVMHAVGPFHPRARRGARNSIEAFTDLSAAVDSAWGALNRLLIFAPDHGAHDDPASGGGNHGTEAAEDMHVTHYLGIRAHGSGAARAPRK